MNSHGLNDLTLWPSWSELCANGLRLYAKVLLEIGNNQSLKVLLMQYQGVSIRLLLQGFDVTLALWYWFLKAQRNVSEQTCCISLIWLNLGNFMYAYDLSITSLHKSVFILCAVCIFSNTPAKVCIYAQASKEISLLSWFMRSATILATLT